MSRTLRILGVVASLLAIVIAVGLWETYRAVRHVQPFYRDAVQMEPIELEQAGRELETQATALYSNVEEAGQWSAVFTQEQLNGWLATELSTNYHDLLPANIRDPRIAILPEKIQVGFMSNQAGLDTVISIDTEVFLTKPGMLAIRLLSVRAGSLPLPPGQIAAEIQAASQSWSLPVRWTQSGGVVVALIDLADPLSSENEVVTIKGFELLPGEIFISGQTERPTDTIPQDPEIQRLTPPDSDAPAASNTNQQSVSGDQSNRQ
jgi:hypothetical protein